MCVTYELPAQGELKWTRLGERRPVHPIPIEHVISGDVIRRNPWRAIDAQTHFSIVSNAQG